MSRIQVQGVHHITFVGSNRETTIDFYQGVLGMPLVFEQPNLDVPEETHLYFDAGDGRYRTVRGILERGADQVQADDELRTAIRPIGAFLRGPAAFARSLLQVR